MSPRARGRLTTMLRPYGPKIAILAIVAALVGLVWVANTATTGSDAASQSLPDEVDRLIPVSGGTILRQATVGIDERQLLNLVLREDRDCGPRAAH